MDKSPLLEKAAAAYWNGGISLVPINKETKRPFAKLLPQAKDEEGKPLYIERTPDGSTVITTKKTGIPKGTWEPFQRERCTKSQLDAWLRSGIAAIAAVGGKVSGGLEIIDFDDMYTYEEWRWNVGEFADTLPTQLTGSRKGMQVAIRSENPERNMKLAWVPDSSSHSRRRIAAETRGEHGYALMPYSLHPSGNIYERVRGKFSEVPLLEMAVRNALMDEARGLCKAPKSLQELRNESLREYERSSSLNAGSGDSVIAMFNERTPVVSMMIEYGYTQSLHAGRWSRPGQKESSGVALFEKTNSTYNFSSNDPLDSNRDGKSWARKPFDYLLEFGYGGNVREAVREAAIRLGISYTQLRQETPWLPAFEVEEHFVDDAEVEMMDMVESVAGTFVLYGAQTETFRFDALVIVEDKADAELLSQVGYSAMAITELALEYPNEWMAVLGGYSRVVVVDNAKRDFVRRIPDIRRMRKCELPDGFVTINQMFNDGGDFIGWLEGVTK